MKFADWIGFCCFLIALLVLWQFRQILLLVFTAVVLAIAINSLVNYLQRISQHRNFRLPRSRAVLVALVIVLLLILAFFGLVLPPFLDQFQQLIELVPAGLRQLVSWLNDVARNPPAWLPELAIEPPKLPELTREIGNLAQNLLGNAFAFFGNSLGVLLQLLFVVVLTLMFLVNPLAYRRLFIILFPSFYRRRADEILTKCEKALLGWMAGVCINSAFVAVTCALGLSLLQVPFVFAHALLAGVFNFVPNIGPFASAIFPIAVALIESPWKALAVTVLYVIVQNLESYWFSPMVMHKQVSLLPAATLTAQLFFTKFLGFLGLVLALPLAVVVKTWVEEAFVKDVLDHWQRHETFAGSVLPVVTVEPEDEATEEEAAPALDATSVADGGS